VFVALMTASPLDCTISAAWLPPPLPVMTVPVAVIVFVAEVGGLGTWEMLKMLTALPLPTAELTITFGDSVRLSPSPVLPVL